MLSVVAILISAATAATEGNWRRRPGLAMGFCNHGGMWSDLLLLPMANAAIVPHLVVGWWLLPAVGIAVAAAMAVHVFWYRANRGGGATEHMWPARRFDSWARDLSWAGWLHVLYVAGELTLLAGFAWHAMPSTVLALTALIFTVHVPIGLLQPHWCLTGEIRAAAQQKLLAACLITLWTVTLIKWWAG